MSRYFSRLSWRKVDRKTGRRAKAKSTAWGGAVAGLAHLLSYLHKSTSRCSGSVSRSVAAYIRPLTFRTVLFSDNDLRLFECQSYLSHWFLGAGSSHFVGPCVFQLFLVYFISFMILCVTGAGDEEGVVVNRISSLLPLPLTQRWI